jgi:hypothetical protein
VHCHGIAWNELVRVDQDERFPRVPVDLDPKVCLPSGVYLTVDLHDKCCDVFCFCGSNVSFTAT